MTSPYATGTKFKTKPHPKKIKLPSVPMVLHEHDAEKAGKHYDLRLAGKGDWAIKNFPQNPGEKFLAMRQPTHPLDYYNFEGEIESGYGKGQVRKAYHGKARIKSWDDKKVSFEFNKKKYALINTSNADNKDRWLILMKKNAGEISNDNERLIKALRYDSFADALKDIGIAMQPQTTSQPLYKDCVNSYNTTSSNLRALNPYDGLPEDPYNSANIRAYKDHIYKRDRGENGPNS